jgi:hypothetical protein
LREVIKPKDAAEVATQATKKVLANGPRFDLDVLVYDVVGEICRRFTGIPRGIGGEELHAFLRHFVNITRYSSFPYPEPWVEEKAIASGAALTQAYAEGPDSWEGALAERLRAGYSAQDGTKAPAVDPIAARDAVIVANVGFVPPALAMLTAMLVKWLNNGDMLQPRLSNPQSARAEIIQELKNDPTFTTIYRARTEDPQAPLRPVVAGIQSAYVAEESERTGAETEGSWRWMFGGTYGQSPAAHRGAHACPMQPEALAIITAVVSTVASYVQDKARAGNALARISPLVYELEPIVRTLPGGYSAQPPAAREPASIGGGASASIAANPATRAE